MVLLQLVAGAALPYADALLEGEAVGLPTHVESPHNEDCPAAHDHLFCQVVRSLGSASTSRDIAAPIDLGLLGQSAGTLGEHDGPLPRPPHRGPETPRPPPVA